MNWAQWAHCTFLVHVSQQFNNHKEKKKKEKKTVWSILSMSSEKN